MQVLDVKVHECVFDGITRVQAVGVWTMNACDCWALWMWGFVFLFGKKSPDRQACDLALMVVSPVLMHATGTENRMVQETLLFCYVQTSNMES